jgi:hypothetical protein
VAAHPVTRVRPTTPARQWGGLYRRVGPVVVILGLQDRSDKMLSESMDCRDERSPD